MNRSLSHKKDKKFNKKGRLCTEMVCEDHTLMHNIKVKGYSCHTGNTDQHNQKQNIKSKTIEAINESFSKSQLAISIKIWASKTAKVVNNKKNSYNINTPNLPSNQIQCKRQVLHRCNQSKLGKDSRTLQTYSITKPELTTTFCKQHNLNEQTYCNFKGILDNLNKTKQSPGQGQNQSNKKLQTNIVCNIFRPRYKKPNIYQYQEFYRQNYQVKHLKDALIQLKKCENPSLINQNIQEQNQNQSSFIQKKFIQKKISKVFIASANSTKMVFNVFQDKNCRQEGDFSQFLQAKKSIQTERRAINRKNVVNYLNKTHSKKMNSFSLDIDKIGPWKSYDHQQETTF